MQKDYIKFFKKASILTVPVLSFVLLYMYLDPFKVIKHYNSYFRSGYPTYVCMNKDFVSTQTFINNYETYKYDAFILGNSRSMFYQVGTWKKYIHSDNCFHFDASGETLIGINRKIKFLDKTKVKLSNVIIILDSPLLGSIQESQLHLFSSHPALSDNNWFAFELKYFKAFMSPDFLAAYIDFKISNQVKPYMVDNCLLDDKPFDYLLKYNEVQFNLYENLIKSNNYYTEKRMKPFYSRPAVQRYSHEVIKETQLQMLQEIADILKKNNTNYRIIVNPLYDQIKLNQTDKAILDSMFGQKNVFDFSGINSITKDYHNYYENSHYRPRIADSIMGVIYK